MTTRFDYFAEYAMLPVRAKAYGELLLEQRDATAKPKPDEILVGRLKEAIKLVEEMWRQDCFIWRTFVERCQQVNISPWKTN